MGGERVYAIQTFDEKITIQVSWSETAGTFVKENWKWLWTTLLVPIAGWLWAKRAQKGKRGSQRKRH